MTIDYAAGGELLRAPSQHAQHPQMAAAVRDADIVLVGIGVIPCDELAVHAGLASEDGIVVDQNARTGDPQ